MLQVFKALETMFLQLIKFSREIFSKKTLTLIGDQLRDPYQSDEVKAFSAAFGVFMGILPIWGLQTLAAIFLAMIFKLNKPLVVIFSQVSLPPLLPVIVWLSYKAGFYWTGVNVVSKANISFQNINGHFLQYVYGSVTLALAGAIAIGLLTLTWLKLIRAVKQSRLTASLKKAV
jgi:uncharacterized protein (DUF2062 family)